MLLAEVEEEMWALLIDNMEGLSLSYLNGIMKKK